MKITPSVFLPLKDANVNVIAVSLSVERLFVILARNGRVVGLLKGWQLRQGTGKLLLFLEIVTTSVDPLLLILLPGDAVKSTRLGVLI